LLRGIPRTASITVGDAAELWAIPGEVFIDELATQQPVAQPLMATLRVRLARTHPHLVDFEPPTPETAG
jgi:hypothetical protein